MNSLRVPVIGTIRTPYATKFAVPRQAGLTPAVRARIEFCPPYANPQAFRALEGFSHVHVLFAFDRIAPAASFRPMVRPPGLGGNRRVGVFASRSPFRPSRIGLSVLRLGRVIGGRRGVVLEVYGADMADGTPVLDIKPYLPWADAVPDARSGYAGSGPPQLSVEFAPAAAAHPLLGDPQCREDLMSILASSPQPAYRGDGDGQAYTATLYGHEITFCVSAGRVVVTAISGGGH